jgi:hypothetical protein
MKTAKKKRTFRNWSLFSCLKASEGGMAQAFVMSECRRLGIPVRRGYSPFVGHYGIEVPTVFAHKLERQVLHWK